jgi:hypothetical protein
MSPAEQVIIERLDELIRHQRRTRAYTGWILALIVLPIVLATCWAIMGALMVGVSMMK